MLKSAPNDDLSPAQRFKQRTLKSVDPLAVRIETQRISGGRPVTYGFCGKVAAEYFGLSLEVRPGLYHLQKTEIERIERHQSKPQN